MSGVDVLARNLARSAADATTRGRTLETLRRSIARVGGRLPAVMASPPTIANLAFAALPANWTDYQLTSAPGVNVNVDRFTFTAANWGPRTGTFPGYFQWRATPSYGGNGAGTITANGQDGGRIRFTSFAPVLEIGWGDVTTAGQYRLKVDGDYVQVGPMIQNGGGYTRLTWGDGTATYRKLRHYELEGINTNFQSVRCASIYPPAPWPVEDGLRMIVHGDSMVGTVIDTTAESARLHGNTCELIGNLCGQPDCWNSGVGGTGWIANTGGTRSRFNERVVLDVVTPAPDVIWEMGGKGDISASGMTQAGMQALVETWLSQVTAALPNVVIFMTGPISSKTSENSGTNVVAVASAKQAAAAKYPRNVRYLDNLGSPAWIAGTGKQGTTTNDGPADWAIGSDGVHPTAEGHQLQATRFVKAAVAAMAGWR